MYKKLKLIVCILFFLQIKESCSQDLEARKQSNFEFLMNISNAISRFAGNGPLMKVEEEPFLFGLKYTVNKKKEQFD